MDVLIWLGLGLFYAFAGVVGVRAAMTEALLDAAIAGIGGQRRDRLDIERTAWIATFTVLVGVGGALLTVRSALAAPVLIAAAASQAVYLFVLAPTRFDAQDPPDARGRRATWNAFGLYLLATAVVVWGWVSGRLVPFSFDLSQNWQTAVALALSLAGAAFVAHFFSGLDAKPQSPALSPADLDDDAPSGGDLTETVLRITPSWGATCLFDDATNQPIYVDEAATVLPAGVIAQAEAFTALFQSLADPDAPGRNTLRAEANWNRLNAAGLALFEAIDAVRPGRVRHDPLPAPVEAQVELAPGMLVRAEANAFPVWHDDPREDGAVGDIAPDALGCSWALARGLEAWASRYNDAYDWDDPAAPLRLTDAERQAHCAEGLALAQRLVAELAATGRATVGVRYIDAVGAETVLVEKPVG